MEMLATVIDRLLEGNTAAVGDILMQRFKAVESTGSSDLPWNVAEHMELIAPANVSCMDRAERSMAVADAYKLSKVNDLMKKGGTRN